MCTWGSFWAVFGCGTSLLGFSNSKNISHPNVIQPTCLQWRWFFKHVAFEFMVQSRVCSTLRKSRPLPAVFLRYFRMTRCSPHPLCSSRLGCSPAGERGFDSNKATIEAPLDGATWITKNWIKLIPLKEDKPLYTLCSSCAKELWIRTRPFKKAAKASWESEQSLETPQSTRHGFLEHSLTKELWNLPLDRHFLFSPFGSAILGKIAPKPMARSWALANLSGMGNSTSWI